MAHCVLITLDILPRRASNLHAPGEQGAWLVRYRPLYSTVQGCVCTGEGNYQLLPLVLWYKRLSSASRDPQVATVISDDSIRRFAVCSLLLVAPHPNEPFVA